MTKPFYRVFDDAVLRYPRHAELVGIALLAGCVYAYITKRAHERGQRQRAALALGEHQDDSKQPHATNNMR